MKSTKKLAMLATALIMGTSIAAFTACDDGTVVLPPHEHSYNYVVTKEPTCEEEGSETGVCPIDGATDTRPIPAKGHSYGEWTVTKEATCEEAGSETAKCTVCDHEETRVIEAKGHKSDNWVVTKEATCEEAGEESANCSVCGKEGVTRPIPATGHSYGKWEVSVLPDNDTVGSIKRVCSKDSAHVDVKELPALSQTDKYKSIVNNGKIISCVFDADGEDVAFNVAVNLDLDTAVEFAVENMDKVTDGTVDFIKKMGTNEEDTSGLTFAYGDNYLEIHDEGNISTYNGDVSMYISKMDDSYFFPLEAEGNILNGVKSLELDLDKFFEKGTPYSLMYAEHTLTQGVTFYGAGDLISTLYTIGKANENGDFKAEKVVDNGDGTKTFAFSFGYRGATFGYQKEGYFRVYDVSFVLDENYVLKSARISNVGYVKNTMDGSTGAVTDTHGYEIDGTTGQVTVGDGATPLYTQTIVVNHNNGLSEKPVNKYKYEDFVIQSLDVMKDGEKLESGATLDMVATLPITLKIDNVNPETYNTNFDSINMYRVKDDGTLEECSFMYTPSDDWHIKVNYAERDPLSGNISRTLTINPYIAGEQTFVIKTENIEYSFKLNIKTICPEANSFKPSIYFYDDVTEEVTWQELNTHELYVGQPLRFTATVEHPAYEEAGYTVSVKNEAGEDVTSACITSGFANGVEVSIFKATDTGKYTVTLTNVKGESRTIVLNVTVKEAPSVADILKGKYENADNEVTVAFTPAEEGATSGAAEIVLGSGDAAVTTTVNYVFNNNANKTIDVTYVSGANDYEYSLELTESYELLLKYKNSRGVVKKMILVQEGKLIDTVSGTYALKGNDGSAIMHKVSTTGIYHLSFNKAMSTIANSYYTGYALFDESGEQISFTVFKTSDSNINLVLTKGQSVQVRAMMAPPSSANVEYTFEWVGFIVNASAVTLDKETAEMVVGGENLTLTATVAPEDTFDKTVTWSSSDDTIATVDANGVVTAKKAGTVTITATTSNGKTASCTITITSIPVTGISVDKSEVTMDYSERVHIEPTIAPDNASDKKWDVTCEGCVSIQALAGQTGFDIIPTGEGTGTVTVYSWENHEIKTIINVTVTMRHVESVALDKTEAEVLFGTPLTLTPSFTPENSSNKTGTCESSDSTVASVNSNGVVTGLKMGTATITFTSNDGSKTATCVVTVKYPTIAEGTENTAFSLSRNMYTRFEFKGDPNTKYVFKTVGSSYGMLGQLNAEGTVGVSGKAGEALGLTTDENGYIWLQVLASNRISSASITVGKSMHVESVALNKESTTLVIGTAETLSVTFTPSSEHLLDMSGTWTSSDSSIASVSNAGYVQGIAPGTVTVTFVSTDGEKSATCTVRVKDKVVTPEESLTFRTTGDEGYTDIVLKAKGEPNTPYIIGVSGTTIRYNIKDSNGTTIGSNTSVAIATTDENGDLTFKFYPRTYSAVTVTFTLSKPIAVESVALNKTELELFKNKSSVTETLTVTFTPADATVKTGTWTSSNTNVATVDTYGIVTAVGAGTATITFTSNSGSKTATCEVTVKENPLKLGANEVTCTATTRTVFTFRGDANANYVLKAASGYRMAALGSTNYSDNEFRFATDANGKFDLQIFNNTEVETTTLTVEVYYPYTVITQYGVNIGSDTDASSTAPLIYRFTVGEGESYKIQGVTNAHIVVGTTFVDGDVDGTDGIDIENLTQGTYYIALYSNEYGTTNAWFTVIKNEA